MPRQNENLLKLLVQPYWWVSIALSFSGFVFLQCLVRRIQWLSAKVKVSVVQEMYGILTVHQVTEAVMITPGLSTEEVKNFALDKPIDMVEGNQLSPTIGKVQKGRANRSALEGVSPEPINLCPGFGVGMLFKTAVLVSEKEYLAIDP